MADRPRAPRKHKGPRTPAPPIQYHPWTEGINPNLDPARAAAIRESRRLRAAELEAFEPGAGARYMEAHGA